MAGPPVVLHAALAKQSTQTKNKIKKLIGKDDPISVVESRFSVKCIKGLQSMYHLKENTQTDAELFRRLTVAAESANLVIDGDYSKEDGMRFTIKPRNSALLREEWNDFDNEVKSNRPSNSSPTPSDSNHNNNNNNNRNIQHDHNPQNHQQHLQRNDNVNINNDNNQLIINQHQPHSHSHSHPHTIPQHHQQQRRQHSQRNNNNINHNNNVNINNHHNQYMNNAQNDNRIQSQSCSLQQQIHQQQQQQIQPHLSITTDNTNPNQSMSDPNNNDNAQHQNNDIDFDDENHHNMNQLPINHQHPHFNAHSPLRINHNVNNSNQQNPSNQNRNRNRNRSTFPREVRNLRQSRKNNYDTSASGSRQASSPRPTSQRKSENKLSPITPNEKVKRAQRRYKAEQHRRGRRLWSHDVNHNHNQMAATQLGATNVSQNVPYKDGSLELTSLGDSNKGQRWTQHNRPPPVPRNIHRENAEAAEIEQRLKKALLSDPNKNSHADGDGDIDLVVRQAAVVSKRITKKVRLLYGDDYHLLFIHKMGDIIGWALKCEQCRKCVLGANIEDMIDSWMCESCRAAHIIQKRQDSLCRSGYPMDHWKNNKN